MATVLIVDDSAIDRSLAGGLLKDVPDLAIEFAVNGQDALDKIARQRPDLVLTDWMMPEMDGLELIARVTSEYPLIPVILMTGKGSEQTAVQALQTGAASYVPKGVLTALLVDTVVSVLDAAREEQCHFRLMNCLTQSDTTFTFGNDTTMIGPLVNYLHRTIRAIGLCDEANGIRVCVALEEAMNNALFHGNLEISSHLRTTDTKAYQQLVQQRLEKLPFAQRSVHVRARFTRSEGIFVVRDEGPGFDPQALPDPTDPANLEKASGRGLLLMRTFMDSVQYNTAGNEVTMIKRLANAGGDCSHCDH